jgi:hypothetical protein
LYPSGNTTVQANWNMNVQLTADCGPNGAELRNTLYVVSRSTTYDPMNIANPYQDVLEPATTPFLGRQVQACSRGGGPSTPPRAQGEDATKDAAHDSPLEAEESGERASSAAFTSTALKVGPIDSDGDWLLYGELTASNFFWGNRLMRQGVPLRANLIAVAAVNIDWSYDFISPFTPGHRHVRRALGDLSIQPYPAVRFPQAPQNCIMVWQNNALGREYIVDSECRQRPNLIHLDPQQDVLVQVNHHNILQRTYTGSFGLWVKIVD